MFSGNTVRDSEGSGEGKSTKMVHLGHVIHCSTELFAFRTSSELNTIRTHLEAGSRKAIRNMARNVALVNNGYSAFVQCGFSELFPDAAINM